MISVKRLGILKLFLLMLYIIMCYESYTIQDLYDAAENSLALASEALDQRVREREDARAEM